MKEIRIGVVGVGKMGELHLKKFQSLPGVSVCGVFDIDPDRIRLIEKQYGIPQLKSLDSLLLEADGIVVASTTPTHYQIACRALEQGTHVLVEKPIAEKLTHAEELVRLASAKGVCLQTGLIERFRFHALCRDEGLDSVRYAEAHRLSPNLGREGGIDVVTDLMIHDLDLVLSLIKEDPVSVSATGVPVVTNQVDMANVRLEYANGAVANLSVSRVSEKAFRKLRVFSLNSYLSMDFIANSVKRFSRKNGSIQRESFEEQDFDALQAQAEHFVECIRGNATPLVSGEDGLRALRYAQIIRDRIMERAAWMPPAEKRPSIPLSDHLHRPRTLE